MVKYENTLAFSCSHLPFEHPDYLDFLVQTARREKCTRFVHLGDITDNHAINYHEHDPDGKSPKDEMVEAKKHLKPWFKAFPKLYVCMGNHDTMVTRKAKSTGLPSGIFKKFREMWGFPNGWEEALSWVFDDVKYMHGTNRSGRFAHLQTAHDNRKSTVMGHLHTNAGVEWTANDEDCIFGMAVGCGIDRDQYAFNYGVDFKYKPVLGCGVVYNKGAHAAFIPMDLGKKVIHI